MGTKLMNKKLIYVLVGAVVIIGVYFLGVKGVSFGGADVVNPMNPIFTNGFRVGNSATQIIDKDGALTIAGTATLTGATTLTGASILGSGGTAISFYKCGTATWNPVSIGSTTTALASTSVTVGGAALGDVAIVSISNSTSSELWRITAKVTAASTTQVMLTSLSADALDLTTTTVKVCVFH